MISDDIKLEPSENQLEELHDDANIAVLNMKDEKDDIIEKRTKNEKEDNSIDMSVKMLCDLHKCPAVFFSNELGRYMCFKCLMDQNNLLYIDKTYKNVMEDFLRIRDYSKDINVKNSHKAEIVHDWKSTVRSHLM